MTSTLYAPPTPFMNARLAKRASALLNGGSIGTSMNSLNLLELDELLGWAESAKATPHQSVALDELDKLLGEFKIETLSEKLGSIGNMVDKHRIQRTQSYHQSANDVCKDVGQPPPFEKLANRVFSDPRFDSSSQKNLSFDGHGLSTTFDGTLPRPLPEPPVGPVYSNQRNDLNSRSNVDFRTQFDQRSEISSVQHHRPLSNSPSVCSSQRYSHSFSSSEKASNYTLFSNSIQRNSSIIRGNTSQYSTMNRGSTLRSNASTLKSNKTGKNSLLPLKFKRKKSKAKFILCTPV